MAKKDGSAALGAPEVAGMMVNPKGMAKKMTASVAGGVVGGAVGSLAANLKTGGAYAGAPDVPSFGRVGYLTASADDIALVKTKSGAMKMKITDEVLARVPRTEIVSMELDKGMLLSHLKIVFANDVIWELDIPKVGKKDAIRFVEALGGKIA